MVNLNMIDTIGSGIKRMFVIQKNKFFPLPVYDFLDNKVKVQITGKVVDVNYARKLAQFNELSLNEIILLDKVSKHKPLADSEIKYLKKQKLIEGRKPNFHISSCVAKATGEKADYIKLKAFDEEIRIFSPVLGFLPSRSKLFLIENLPNFGIEISLPSDNPF